MNINFTNTKYFKSFFNSFSNETVLLPEIAFVGRSNVGKSSLINFLTNIKNLAKVSQTPGKTRSINYFNVDEKFFLVDLPGYGYSRMSKEMDKNLKILIEKYFTDNKKIKSICHLIDSRHKATSLDKQMNLLLESLNYPYFIMLTKSDKIKNSIRKEILNDLQTWLPDYQNKFILFSSVQDGEGKKEFQNYITKIIN